MNQVKDDNNSNHRCCRCGKTGDDVTYGSDPYMADINGDDTPVWECENCRDEAAMDI